MTDKEKIKDLQETINELEYTIVKLLSMNMYLKHENECIRVQKTNKKDFPSGGAKL